TGLRACKAGRETLAFLVDAGFREGAMAAGRGVLDRQFKVVLALVDPLVYRLSLDLKDGGKLNIYNVLASYHDSTVAPKPSIDGPSPTYLRQTTGGHSRRSATPHFLHDHPRRHDPQAISGHCEGEEYRAYFPDLSPRQRRQAALVAAHEHIVAVTVFS
ncbi:hypothetical protein AbraIFM66950_001193, partial [Aspergillus brasiliensis]